MKKTKENQRGTAESNRARAEPGPVSVQKDEAKVGFDIHHHPTRILRYLEKGEAQDYITASPFRRL